MDLVTELNRRGGAARVATLTAAGVPTQAVRAALVQGKVRRVARGVVALPEAQRVCILAATIGAEHTCVSALAAMGIPLPRLDGRPHLAVPHSFTSHGRDLGGIRLHYVAGRVAAGTSAGIEVALDAAGACLDEVWHLVAVDSALNKGMITVADVAAFRRTTRTRRDFLLSHADGRSQSAGETIARLLLVRAGHRVCPQAYVRGAGYVDIEIDGVAILEVDGYAHHDDERSFRRDRERDRVSVTAGRPVLRYAAGELMSPQIPDVVAEVRRVLAAWAAPGRGRLN